MALFNKLDKYRDFGLFIIRVGLGVMFIYHGLPKLTGGIKSWEQVGSATKYIGIHFWPALWGLLSACAETFGGFLLILGLGFRMICLILLINMIVAVLFNFGIGGNIAKAAPAIEDAIVFAGLIFVGPGKYSVDKK
jgi:putative oxidoreductase